MEGEPQPPAGKERPGWGISKGKKELNPKGPTLAQKH
jgi:hypothetical protein